MGVRQGLARLLRGAVPVAGDGDRAPPRGEDWSSREMEVTPPPTNPDPPRSLGWEGELDLRDLFVSLWRGKFVIAACVAVALAVGFYRLTNFVPLYTARMIVARSAQAQDISPVRELTAGLIGGSFRQQAATPFDEFTVLLGSYLLAERLEERHRLLRQVFPKMWDKDSQSWVAPEPTWRDMVKGYLGRYIDLPQWSPPTVHRLADYIGENVKVERIPESPLLMIVYRHKNAQFAGQFLTWVYAEADAIVREQHRRRVAAQLRYLRERLGSETKAEYREALIRLVSQNEQTMMLLDGDQRYVAEIVEPINVSDRPSTAGLVNTFVLSVAIGVFGGSFLVMAFVGVRAALRRRPGIPAD